MNEDDQAAKLDAEFTARCSKYIENHSAQAQDKPAKKFLFFTLTQPSKEVSIPDVASYRNIKLKVTYKDSRAVGAKLMYSNGAPTEPTITLESGLLKPPAIVIDNGKETEEGLAVEDSSDAHYQDFLNIVGQ